MIRKQEQSPATEEATDGTEGAPAERTYVAPCDGSLPAFDPLHDLNLPGSYDEVRLRFQRLQGGRRGPHMN